MHFLNPAAFWAFSLLLIPILVHLFNFRRLKKVYFSNLFFLRNVKQESRSKSTLKKLLVLFLRLLAFTFLVIAFARPVLLSDYERRGQEDPLIYLDNSYSMQQTDPSGQPLLYLAHSVVDVNAKTYAELGQVRFMDNDKTLLFGGANTEKMSDMTFSSSSLRLSEAMEKAKLYNPDVIHVFSDLQRNVSLPFNDILEDTSTLYYIHKLAASDERNVYVDSVFLDGLSELSQKQDLSISIKNTGVEPVESLLVKLEKDGGQLASLSVSIAGQSTTTLSIQIGGNIVATGNYKIVLEDNPVVFDNEFYFRIGNAVKSSIVILSEKEDIMGLYFRKVFSNAKYFNVISDDVDNVSFENLMGADLVVLAGLEKIPAWFISQYSEIRGSILVVPAYDIEMESYESLMHLKLSKRAIAESSVSEKSLENPFFDGVFRNKRDNMSLPKVMVRFAVSGFVEPILSTNNGERFLLKSGQEGIYFLTTPLIDSLTNFQKHSLFVPIMYRVAHPTTVSRMFYRMGGEAITLRTDSVLSQEVLELVNGDEVFIPSYHFESGNIVLQIPDVLRTSGFYDLIAEKDTLKRIAINPSKTESEIESVSSKEFEQLIAGYDHITYEEIDSESSFLGESTKDQKADSLWKYALILALFFLVIESILLRFI